jgi:hypothetical protein
MTQKAPITAKNFGNKLSGWKRSAASMRGTAQELLDFGFAQYAEHGDAGYLSRMCHAAEEIKGLNAKRMMDYVLAHANVKWNKDKHSFSKAKKKDEPAVEERAVNWFEYGVAKSDEPKAFDVNKRLESLLKGLRDAENLKVEIEGARELLAELGRELDNVELEILEAQEEVAEAA